MYELADELRPQHHLFLERQRQLRLNPFNPNNQGYNFAFTNRQESDLSRLGRENLGDPYSDASSYESDSDSDIDEQHLNLRLQHQRENCGCPPSEESRYQSHSNPDNRPQDPDSDSHVYEFDSDYSADSGDECEPDSNHRENEDSGRVNLNNITRSDRESEIDRYLRDNLLGRR